MKFLDERVHPRSDSVVFTHRITVNQPRQSDVAVPAFTAVEIGLIGPRDRLVIAVAAGGEPEQPIAERQRIVSGVATGAAPARIAAAQVVIETEVEQVIQRPQIIVRKDDSALIFAGRLGARVIGGYTQPERKALLPTDDEVAVTRPGIRTIGRRDLYVGFGGGYAFEVFQRLLDVAQVERVARADGHRIPLRGARIRSCGKTNAANPAGNQGQSQRSGVQVLRFGEHTGCDVTTAHNRVLHALHHQIDPSRAQTTPDCRVIRTRFRAVGRSQSPLEFFCGIAAQQDAFDFEAGRLINGQAAQIGRRLGAFQTHIGRWFLLLAQDALALLLAQQFLIGSLCGGNGLRPGCCQGHGHDAEHQQCSAQRMREPGRGSGLEQAPCLPVQQWRLHS